MKARRNRCQSRIRRFKRWAGVTIAPLLISALLLTGAIHDAAASSGQSATPTSSVISMPDRIVAQGDGDRSVAQFRSEWLNQELKKAQTPVTLDGRRLFFVSRAGEYPADVRAQLIQDRLNAAIESSGPIAIEVRQSNQMPAIFLNDRQLLTVTQADVTENFSPQAQAEIWAAEIQKALQQAQRERDGKFIQRSLIHTIAILVVVFALDWGLRRLWQQYREPLRQRLRAIAPNSDEDDSTGVLDLLMSLTLGIARVTLLVAAALYISNLFPVTRQWSYRITNALSATFTSPLLTLGDRSYSVLSLLVLSAMLMASVALSGIATNLLRCRVLRMMSINRGAEEAIVIITKYGLIVIATLVVLQIWGLDITSLTIVASALGVGIGFGFQDIAKNFGSGLVLLFERRIQVGDFVEVGQYVGTVERIGGRSSVIRTLDQVFIIVPNSRFLETEVINWTHSNPVSRLHLPVGVSYRTDAREVENALLDAAKGHPDVLLVPSPRVIFKGFGDSSIDFELLVWTAEPAKQFFLKSDLYFRIFALLGDRSIEIPFPQRDLHVRSGNLPVQFSPQMEQALLQLIHLWSKNHKGG